MMSSGYLEHPDMKRFELNDATAFLPPRPTAWAQNLAAGIQQPMAPSFGYFFATYFAGKSWNAANPKCSLFMEGMKKCWENNSEDPIDQCQYYIQGFERTACAN